MFKLKNTEQLNSLVKASARLEEVVQNLYGIELFPTGTGDYKACCPFHDEKTPSFGIRADKQVYHCFGCKEGGDIISFVQKMDSTSYIDALLAIAEHVKIDVTPFKSELTAEEKRNHVLTLENLKVAESCASNLPDEWVRKRKLDKKVLADYKVGYSTGVPDKLDPHGLEFDWIGKWQDVITVPLQDEYGHITGFRNRLLDPDANIKVIGPKQTHPLKQPVFYGLSHARRFVRSAGYLILVEGEVDVWQMVGHGYRNTAATMGTKLNADMIAVLDALAINRVILLADNDEAGRKFSKSVAESLIGSKIAVKIGKLGGDGKDPDEILLSSGTGPIDFAIANAKYAFEHYIESKGEEHNLDTATGQLEFFEEVKSKIANASILVKDLAIKKLSEVTKTSYDVINDFILESESESAELHNTMGERAVLKRMILDEDFTGDIVIKLKPDDFFLKKHRVVFDAIVDLYKRQQDISQEIVKTYLENKGIEGVSANLRSIMGNDVDEHSAGYMVTDLKDKSVRRFVQDTSRDAANRLSNTKADAGLIIQDLSQKIAKAFVGAGSKVMKVSDVVFDRMKLIHERMKNRNPIIGINLGDDFHVLNMTLHGLQEKRYVVLAAPSGAGKTAFGCALAKRIAVDLKIPTTFFTFETGVETLTDRIISNISGITSDQFLTGYLKGDDIERVQDAAATLAASPLVITERGMVFEEFAAILRHDVIQRGTKVCIVDYIQLMELADARGISRHLEVGKISRGILELAKELNIAIIAVAQQNRESVKGNNASKEGVGDSYKISQDCDIYIVFREKTKEEIQADGPQKGNRVLILDKNRHGKAGIILNYIFDNDIMRFTEVRTNTVRQ